LQKEYIAVFHVTNRERRSVMQCPVCKHREHSDLDLHSEGFTEDIMKCRICGTVWSVNHGLTEVVEDAQEKSFLEAQSECVEGDDYNFPGQT
jgi:uncharacterized Zn finger protein